MNDNGGSRYFDIGDYDDGKRKREPSLGDRATVRIQSIDRKGEVIFDVGSEYHNLTAEQAMKIGAALMDAGHRAYMAKA
jgi:hypothetical protein